MKNDMEKVKNEIENKNEGPLTDNKNPEEKTTTPNSGNIKSSTSNTEEDKESPHKSKDIREEPDIQKKLAELNARNNEINDKYLRLYSDFDNFRKRANKERIELYKFAGEEIITLLLPVMDDLERAIKSMEISENNNKASNEGIQLIYQKMKNILSQQGLKEMEIIEGEFNADLHEAITRIEVQDESKKGKIADVIEKGYYLHEKVIRHAKVVVGA